MPTGTLRRAKFQHHNSAPALSLLQVGRDKALNGSYVINPCQSTI